MNNYYLDFIDYIKSNKKLYYSSILNNYNNNKDLFSELGSKLLKWARQYLGSNNYLKILSDGYSNFVTDVNKSQMYYEKNQNYKYKNYEEVFNYVYNNPNHMQNYHWGVYITTFAWEHHLHIYRVFKEFFIKCLNESNKNYVLDLGSGSGVWDYLLLSNLNNCFIQGVDISQTSVDFSSNMSAVIGMNNNVDYFCRDALTYNNDNREFDACISCFLIEHLEKPELLIENIFNNLKTRGYAFICAALTAAEVDHIYEIKRESELIEMAERNGFRVILSFSAAPKIYSDDYHFLPRSMCMILQKRKNEIW